MKGNIINCNKTFVNIPYSRCSHWRSFICAHRIFT